MSKPVLLFAVYLTFAIGISNAQVYSVALIPDSLKENAHCIIRDYSEELELQSTNSGVEKTKEVYTILNKEGERKASLAIYYDKNSSVSITQIVLYDRNGKKVRKIKQSEIIDVPAYSDYLLYSDNRVIYFKPDYAEYPYSIEYVYERKFTNQISYGCWMPIDDYNISVQQAQLSVKYPKTLKIKEKEFNVLAPFSILTDKEKIDTWKLNNLKAIEDELFDVSLSERGPSVYLMPTELIYDSHIGNANNWKEFGKWVYDLYDGKDELSDLEKLRINNLLIGVQDTSEKIKILYKYMQDNTRYIAIKIGIGGFQPYSAKSVFETGYGECKALSNYMHSILKTNGIKSYSAWVASGRYIVSVFADFPNFSQFNHAILCIPNNKDTIWLECTSQKMPFGFLGDFTDDREVLLITENGGKFAHTKKYEGKDNIRSCSSRFIIDSTGTATCSIKTSYKALQYDEIFELLSSNYDEQKKWLYKHTALPSPQINSFSINNCKNFLPIATVNESITSRNYGSFSGKYMLLPLNLINAQGVIQKMLKPRLSDVLINRSSVDYDTLIYQIPQNYQFESVPSGKTIHSNFGNYSYSVSVNGNELIYTRKFSINQGRYKPNEYRDFYEFLLSISKADNVKIMLTRKI
jgi:hypothetical protein